MPAEPAKLLRHIESTFADISDLHEEYHQRAHPLQKLVGAVTAWLARPAFIRLLEALRLADSDGAGESDPETAAMAIPADPQAVLDKIRSMQAG